MYIFWNMCVYNNSNIELCKIVNIIFHKVCLLLYYYETVFKAKLKCVHIPIGYSYNIYVILFV